ncbi:MAG: hypothetical protein HY288_11565 [Planctomycetia bacterium]|nr:hypothetical protein [Planctomycetia bacterium]
MPGFHSLLRILIAAALLVSAVSSMPCLADGTRVAFDLPDVIECRDVTPKDFATVHPSLKVIEAKFRISARFIAGAESEVVDFLYIVASPDRKMRFQDYLPNTTLESTVADDQIEIIDTTENDKATEASARVGYKALGLGLSKNKGLKKTESSHYKQLAARALVVASGTTDREHGIFFKLRPSKGASLEGAKEFTFLATVPKTWRGDWCTISCAARAKSRGFLSRSVVVPAGVEQAQLGMYLAGDPEAGKLAEELRDVLETHASVLAKQLTKDGDGLLETMYDAVSPQALSGYTTALCGIFRCKNVEAPKKSDPERKTLEEAQKAVLNVQDRLRRIAE